MRKIIPLILLIAAFSTFIINLPNFKKQAKEKEAVGYFKQYFDKKKDPKTGEIAMGLRTKWQQHDAMIASTRGNRREANPIELVEELGPTTVGGRTRAILIDHSNENRIFAGSVSGGLWYSPDKGKNWSALNDAAATLSVTSITQNPMDASVIYYGTGEARGVTYGEIGDGIFKSTDGGKTFSQIPSTLNNNFDMVWSVVHSLTDANTVYVGTHNAGAWRTTDAGLTWTKLITSNTAVTDIEVFSDGSVLLALRGSGIYRSFNGEPNTFTRMPSALAAANGRVEIAKCNTKQEVVYAAMELYNAGLYKMYKSTDTGSTWTELNSIPNIGGIQQIYCFALGVHPTNPDYVFVAGVNALYSKNSGVNWSSASESHADHHAYAFFNGNPDEFLNGNDGGVYLYNWNSINSTNEDLNDGYNVVQFYGGNCAPTGRNILGGTQDNGSHRIINGVHKKVYPADGAIAHISYQNPNLAYIETQYGGLRRTKNFTALNPGFADINRKITDDKPFVSNYEMNLADGTQLYFLSERAMWRTIDSGVSWTKIADYTPACFPIALSREEDPTVFYGGSAGRMYRIENAKTTEVEKQVNLRLSNPAFLRTETIGALLLHPDNKDILYVGLTNTGNEPKLYVASNAMGDTLVYRNISGDLPEGLPINSIAVDPEAPDRVIFVGTDFGVYHTDNGGSNWHKVDEIPNVPVPQLRMRKEDRSLFVFSHGRGVWYLKLKENLKNIPEDKFVQFNVYPNPTKDGLFKVQTDEKLKSIKVYNLLGTLMSDVVVNLDEKSVAAYNFKPGVYLVLVEAEGGKTNTQKLYIGG